MTPPAPTQRKSSAKGKKTGSRSASPKGVGGKSPSAKASKAPSGKKKGAPARKRAVPARSPHVPVAFAALLVAGFWMLFCLWSWLGPSSEPAPQPQKAQVQDRAPARSAQNGSSGEGEANATIMRALVDMSGMPFEESLSAPLEDGVKQVDYALLQTMLRLGLKPEFVSLDKVELRHKGAEAYHFQSLRVQSGPDPLPFATALHEALRAWAEKAELKRGEGGLWTVSVLGTLTHELHLAPPKPDGPPPPSIPHTLPARRPGEPARLVIVMDDLGQSMPAVRSLLALPYPVTFAVWPGSSHAREAALAAHQAGREIIVHLPMEPLGYPKVKPGPDPLLVGADPARIERTVDAALARVPYAVGLNNHMGSRFTTQDTAGLRVVVAGLKNRNLLALDSVTHPASRFYGEARRQGVPALRRDVFLDVSAKRADILKQLQKAENVALLTGRAIAIGHPLPETLAALKEWALIRNRQVELVTLGTLHKAGY